MTWFTANTPPMQETYILEVVEGSGGTPVLSRKGSMFPQATAQETAGPPEVTFKVGVRYTLRLRFLTQTSLSPRATATLKGAWATAEFTPLPAPEDATLSFYAEDDPAESRLNVYFYELNLYAYRGSNVEPATYDLRIITSGRPQPFVQAGLPSPPQGDLREVNLSAADLGIAFGAGATFRASVQVVLGSVRSPWSPEKPRSLLTVMFPPVPADVRLTYEAGKLIGTWLTDSSAQSYWYTLWRDGVSSPVRGGVSHPPVEFWEGVRHPPVEFLPDEKVPIQPGEHYRLGVRAGIGRCDLRDHGQGDADRAASQIDRAPGEARQPCRSAGLKNWLRPCARKLGKGGSPQM